MPDYLEIVPVVASGLFAGAALGISIGDQPARECIDAQHAREHFKEFYKRIAKSQVCTQLIAPTIDPNYADKSCGQVGKHSTLTSLRQGVLPVQASFAAIAAASSAWLAYKGGPSRSLDVTSAVLMGAMLPWTLIVIMPTNDVLLSKKELSDSEVWPVCPSCLTHSPPLCCYGMLQMQEHLQANPTVQSSAQSETHAVVLCPSLADLTSDWPCPICMNLETAETAAHLCRLADCSACWGYTCINDADQDGLAKVGQAAPGPHSGQHCSLWPGRLQSGSFRQDRALAHCVLRVMRVHAEVYPAVTDVCTCQQVDMISVIAVHIVASTAAYGHTAK